VLGQGSVFTLDLPAAAEKPTRTPISTARNAVRAVADRRDA
jgi:hypothetical protein